MFMHPFLEGTFTREHATEKIPYVRFRHSASIEPLLSRGRNDALGSQVEERIPSFPHQLLDAVVDGCSAGRRETTRIHLRIETFANPGDPTPRQPTPQIVHGATDGSEAIVLQDIERMPEHVPQELLPAFALQVFNQSHSSLPGAAFASFTHMDTSAF